MALVVQKYGGTSVATPELIRRVAERIVSRHKQGHRMVVVVSAMGDTTDDMLALANKVSSRPPDREVDMLLACGERISMSLLAMAVQDLGVAAVSLTGGQSGIITDAVHRKARILDLKPDRLLEELHKDQVLIVAGFQGVTTDAEETTLGRGGSNLTAVALAYALKADVCEMNTDVDGIYTADPRVVPEACKLSVVTPDEMLELASAGARVLQSRSVEFAKKYGVVIHVRSSFNENPGTLIKEVEEMEEVVVRGIAHDLGEAKITMRHVPDRPGVAARLFGPLADKNINVDMIIQNTSEAGSTDLSFTVGKTDLDRALEVCQGIRAELGADEVVADAQIAKISVVGVGMRSHAGVAAGMFQALAAANINIHMISTSEIKISCVVGQPDAEKAVRALHAAFKLDKSS
ncbi:MAG: aspartate kinase [Candidatus Handelsmanbacteria bacterium]|nr:aspartate kinase [Candidatus Handelsmanbacteria bacterium]